MGATVGELAVCAGTPGSPGTLAGLYPAGVIVKGACEVNAGPARVDGDLLLAPGSVLLANFARDDKTLEGHSNLVVTGDVTVERGATLFLGCKVVAGGAGLPCADDPNPKHPTLASAGRIDGSLIVLSALGVVVHNTTIGGNVLQDGGGGGLSCRPTGPFLAAKVPVYSDYEDSTVLGNIAVDGITSCWLGFARDQVRGSVVLVGNRLADPDAVEIISNRISGDLVCAGNSSVWDSFDKIQGKLYPRIFAPDSVSGARVGQCTLATPLSPGRQPGPAAF